VARLRSPIATRPRLSATKSAAKSAAAASTPTDPVATRSGKHCIERLSAHMPWPQFTSPDAETSAGLGIVRVDAGRPLTPRRVSPTGTVRL
jgi:hypothetical protein